VAAKNSIRPPEAVQSVDGKKTDEYNYVRQIFHTVA